MKRIALRGIGYLAVVYVVGVVALAIATTRLLDESTALVMEETARVAGEAVASIVNGPIVDDLLSGSDETSEDLVRELNRSERRSSLIERITVVNASGEIVSRNRKSASVLPTPQEIFGNDPRALLEAIPSTTASWPTYVFTVPLERDGELIGYLRLNLSSDPIEALYTGARKSILISAIAGLVVIAVLAFFLHHQLRKQSLAIAGAISSAIEDREVPTGGQYLDIFAAISDLTGEITRLRREAKVRAQLTRLSEINDVGAVIIDRDVGPVYASPIAAEILHLDESRQSWNFIRSLLIDRIDQLRNGHAVAIDLPGTVIRCQPHALENGEVLLLLRDSRIIRSIESDLRVAAYSKSLARLFMGFAHDFKAPLNALLLNVELLKSSVEESGEDDPQIREDRKRWVAVIEQEITRLGRMIESLLGFAAPAKDQRSEFDMSDLLKEIESLIRPQARQQDVELRVDPSDHALTVNAHRDRIKQAVVNVAINALEVMPDGGTLDLRLQDHDGHAVLTIRDTGPGIPEDLREKIFTLHFTTKDAGTGIGLFVGTSILEGEGGYLVLKDTGSQGTTFAIGLPLVSQGRQAERLAG